MTSYIASLHEERGILWSCRTCGWKGREPVKSSAVVPGVGPVTEFTCPQGHWVGSEKP